MLPPVLHGPPLLSSHPAAATSSATRRFSLGSDGSSSAPTRQRPDAFELWWRDVPRLEGTLDAWKRNVKNQADRGGATHFGITERAFMGCAGAAKLPKTREAFENMTQVEARQIARALWKTSGSHRIDDPGVAVVVGDWFWGSNTRAWTGVKAALGRLGIAVPPGAKMDEATLAAINSMPPDRLIRAFSAERRAQHERIVRADASQSVFLRGWQARVDARQVLALASSGRVVPGQSVTSLVTDEAPAPADDTSGRRTRAVLEPSTSDAYWALDPSQRPGPPRARGSERARGSRNAGGGTGAERAWARVVGVEC